MAQQLPNVFSIGWLVERYGVSPESIRNWERQGLIPQTSRTPGGHRRYTAAHVEALDSMFGFKPRPQVAVAVNAAQVDRDDEVPAGSAVRRPSEDALVRSRI